MKNFDRPNVLVAGGAGFIGANICEALLNEYNVVCVDDYSFGHENAIDEMLSHPHFEFIRHDIRESFDFASHAGVEKFRVAYVGFQHIIHAAGAGSMVAVERDPIGTERTLSEGTRQLLELAVASHARFYLISDALVYGSAEGGEISEEHEANLDSTSAVNRVAEAKRFAESLVKTYAQEYSLETVIIRLGIVYGPHMFLGDGRLVSTMIERALHKERIALPLTLTHAQALYSSDLCDAVKKLLTEEGCVGVYNLAGATSYALSEIAGAIEKNVGTPFAIDVTSKVSDASEFWQSQARSLSIHKIKNACGWFPIVRLEDGVRRTVEYLKSLRGVRTLDASSH